MLMLIAMFVDLTDLDLTDSFLPCDKINMKHIIGTNFQRSIIAVLTCITMCQNKSFYLTMYLFFFQCAVLSKMDCPKKRNNKWLPLLANTNICKKYFNRYFFHYKKCTTKKEKFVKICSVFIFVIIFQAAYRQH